MSQKAHHTRIGLFVLGGVLLLLVGLFAFGIRKRFEHKHRLVTYVPEDVDGLAIGSPVKLKGVVVGEVTGLYFSWNRYPGTKKACVIVEFDVKDSVSPVPVTKESNFDEIVRDNVALGLRAFVTSNAITGVSTVQLDLLDPAKNPPFPFDWEAPRYPYVPAAPSSMGRVMGSVVKTLEKIEKIDTVEIGLQVQRTLAAAEATLKRMGELDAKRLSDGAGRTLESAGAAAAEIQGLARDARTKVQAIPAAELGRDARGLLAGLVETNEKLQVAVGRLSAVDVRELNDTLADLRVAARELADALSTIRKQPSQLLLGSAPAPASVLEKDAGKTGEGKGERK